MHYEFQILITIGILLFLGLIAEITARHIRLPRVTLLILCGFIIGPSMLDILPQPASEWFHIIANMALAMVGFLLGGKLDLHALRQHGRCVILDVHC